jgi:hypothetical protein
MISLIVREVYVMCRAMCPAPPVITLVVEDAKNELTACKKKEKTSLCDILSRMMSISSASNNAIMSVLD